MCYTMDGKVLQQCSVALLPSSLVMRTHSAPPQGIAPLLPQARTIADQTTKTRIVSCLQMSSTPFSTAQYFTPFTVTFPTPWILQPLLQQSRSIAGQQHKKYSMCSLHCSSFPMSPIRALDKWQFLWYGGVTANH